MPLFDGIEEFKNVSPALQWAIFVVGVLIAIVAFVSLCVSTWLYFKYRKYNKTKNSIGLAGKDTARILLDKNDLQHIKVSTWGSFIFGNSYSHYFKKVRLRRLTLNKASVTSLAMASEKTALAVLDKKGDKDMKKRVALTPFIYFGPIMFVPLVLIGVLIDIVFFNFTGLATVVSVVAGFAIYVISFVLAILVLKTEIKAQKLSLEMLKQHNMATDEELAMMQDLYKIYNIEYVNDIVMAFLEMIYRVLMLVAKMQNSNANNSNN